MVVAMGGSGGLRRLRWLWWWQWVVVEVYDGRNGYGGGSWWWLEREELVDRWVSGGYGWQGWR